jgi:hypothetical protein
VSENKRGLYMNAVTVKHMYQVTLKQLSLHKTPHVLPERAIIKLKSIKNLGQKLRVNINKNVVTNDLHFV